MAHHHHHNDIIVHLDRGVYIGGDTIFGHILLNISQPIPARSLYFSIKGYEKVFWQETRQESYVEDGQTKWRSHTDDYHSDRDFFKDEFVIIDHPGGFPPGCYSYPFQYRLPDGLPGVFQKKKKKMGDKFKAKIAYKIKAVLKIDSKHDLVSKQHLVVYSKLDAPIAPKHHNKTAEVRTLCCIPRGPVSVEAWVDKNSYVSGETAQIHVKVQNNSTVPVNHFNSKLIREIIVHNNRGHRKHIHKIMSEARYEGCPPGENRSRDVPLILRNKHNNYLRPTTKSNLIECRYHILIEMDIPWAPDIEIPSPVTIYAPQSQTWSVWQPPAWIANAVIQPVNPAVAVPAHLLEERVRNGVFVPPVGYNPYPVSVTVTTSTHSNYSNSESAPLLG
eukprot:TRINITY_DN15657_c0_g1_i1.p1 TRINITY_DN15657_c0_g1~~TRINITY_DN15657_c0_g1_i1.p1  ORF type:complete len:418 (+),score=83.57 TRINITY_DN15657_c0_g1_i1:88-1254(+)